MALLFPDPQRWLVEIAFGAAPDGDPDEWTWTDVSADLKTVDGIAGFNGRSDEQSRARPFQWVFALDNTTGKYTPDHPTSPFYPKVRLGTPCRLTPLLEDGGSGDVPLDAGFIAEWTPQWPEGDLSDVGVTAVDVVDADPENDSSMGGDDPGYARVHVVVSGPLRRLGQGNPPIGSAIARSVPTVDTVQFYWPFEEQRTTSTIASGLPGGDPGEIDPDSRFGAVNLWPGSLPLPEQSGPSSGWRLPVRDFQSQPGLDEVWRVDALFTISEQPTVDALIFTVDTNGTQVKVLRLFITSADSLMLERESRVGVITQDTQPFNGDDLYGQPLRVTFEWDQPGGANVNLRARIDRIPTDGDPEELASVDSGSLGNVAIAGPISVEHPGVLTDNPPMAWGHVAVSSPLDDPYTLNAVQGYLGERAGQRFVRLCQEESVTFQILGDPDATVTMQAQTPTTFVDNLNQIEEADGGILFPTRHLPGMGYRTFVDLLNQGAAVTLDASPHDRQPDIEIPYVPVLDDRDARNDVKVTHDSGESQVRDEDDIRDRGLYPEQLNLSLMNDEQALDRASFEVTRGTWPGMRVRQITAAITQRYELARPWHEMFQGDLIRVENLPPQHPPGDVDLLLRGRSASFTPLDWRETANTTPAGPYRAGVLGGDGELGELGTRYDSSRSYLSGDVDDSQATIDVYVPVQRSRIPNSGFEGADLGTWRDSQGVTLEVTQGRAFRGLGSVRVTPEAGGTSEILSSEDYVFTSDVLDFVHQFSAWVFSDVGGFDVALRFATNSASVSTGTPVTLPAGQWVRLFAEETSTDDGSSFSQLTAIGVVYDDDNETRPIWVDDIEVGLRGQPWVNDATFPAEFPFDIIIGGERMRVTAATVPDAARVQTLTVTRALDGVAVAHTAGRDVRLADPMRFAADPR